MKKSLFSVLVLLIMAGMSTAAQWKFPQNIKFDTNEVYVGSGDTAYTKKFVKSGDVWTIGKIAIVDTNIQAQQDTLNIGSGATGGVKVFQRICFPFGNFFGYDSTKFDTLCTKCGDSTNTAFVNSEGLSSDSLIISAIDTTQMTRTSLGGDSLWVSNGYFVPVTDPAPYIDFMVIGNSGLANTVKVIMMMWKFNGYPTVGGSR